MNLIAMLLKGITSRLGRKNQRGAFLVTSALMMTPIVGMAVLTTDIGMAFLVRTEASNAADLAALAAIKKFGKSGSAVDYAAVREAAAITASHNSTRKNEQVHINTAPITNADNPNGDIIFGFYDHEDGSFTGYTDDQLDDTGIIVNSIRSRVSLSAASGNTPFTFQFASFLEKMNVEFEAMSMISESIASFGIMNIVVVMDTSASMAWRSYKTVEMCPNSSMPYNQDRWFQRAARTDAWGECEDDPLGSDYVMGPVDGDMGAVMPQPMTDIFRVTREHLLEGNALFQNLYRGGMVAFDTSAYEPYSPSGSVAMSVELLPRKAEMIDMLNFSVEQWQAYAQDNRNWNAKLPAMQASYPNLAFPGGFNPPETTYTNTGDALYLATSWIATANAATRTKSTDTIILLTDGRPNCSRPFDGDDPGTASFGVPPICPRNTDVNTEVNSRANNYRTLLEENNDDGALSDETVESLVQDYRRTARDMVAADYDSAGEQWSRANAIMAATHEIKIQAVYFATDPSESCGADGASASPGFAHLQDIAGITGGNAFCAENVECEGPNCLSTIFEQLATERNFVLIHPTASAAPDNDD